MTEWSVKSAGMHLDAALDHPPGGSAAALTLYDRCKAVDKTMRIEYVRVVEKGKE